MLREEHRLRVFANSVLRGIFGPKTGGITESSSKLQNEASDKNISVEADLVTK
jgi:hypothetical protein